MTHTVAFWVSKFGIGTLVSSTDVPEAMCSSSPSALTLVFYMSLLMSGSVHGSLLLSALLPNERPQTRLRWWIQRQERRLTPYERCLVLSKAKLYPDIIQCGIKCVQLFTHTQFIHLSNKLCGSLFMGWHTVLMCCKGKSLMQECVPSLLPSFSNSDEQFYCESKHCVLILTLMKIYT